MDGVRVDTWVETGTEVSPYYDSMLAKLMVYAPTREAAVAKMREAIAGTKLKGVPNNLEFLGELVKDPRFEAGEAPGGFEGRVTSLGAGAWAAERAWGSICALACR
jgi:urea carboxylase